MGCGRKIYSEGQTNSIDIGTTYSYFSDLFGIAPIKAVCCQILSNEIFFQSQSYLCNFIAL